MFRRVREAARRGATQAKSLLASVGRGLSRVGVRLGLAAFTGIKLIGRGIRLLARGVSWTWMTIIEVYAITDAPFIYVIGNVLWWLLRVGETTVNKVRRTEYTWAHDNFPAFTLLNSVAIINLGMYPFVFVVGWLLSPITGKNWFRNLMHGYKVRLLSAADFDYHDRFARDLNFTADTDFGDVWGEATAATVEDTPDSVEGHYRSMGMTLIQRDPNNPDAPYDYMIERVTAAGVASDDEFWLSWGEDEFGRMWSVPLPVGVDPTPPPVAKHAAEEQDNAKIFAEPGDEAPPAKPEVDENGLLNFDLDTVTDAWANSEDTKERSYYFGVVFVRESIIQYPDFLTDEEKQNRARAMVAKDTRNPKTGFSQAYALKGFTEALAKEQSALV